jgi:hypothetical protein
MSAATLICDYSLNEFNQLMLNPDNEYAESPAKSSNKK